MGDPRFLDSAIYPFRYASESVPANTSSQITSTLRTELTALSWTEPVANTFRSPANSAGRYMDLVVTEPSVTRWQMALVDSTGLTVCTRGLSISNSVATTVQYYTGKAHVFIDSGFGPSWTYAFLLECFPDQEQYYPHPAVGNGYLNSSGSNDSQGQLGYCYAIDNVAAGLSQRLKGFRTIGSDTYYPVMASGRYLYDAVWVGQNVDGNSVWSGKFPQALIGPALAAANSDWVIPISASATATFRATNLADGTPYRRIFMRKS